jgi:hypothetical protein
MPINILAFVQALRNKLVHNVANVSFNFPDYIRDMNKEQKRSFIDSFGHSLQEPIQIAGKELSRSLFILENAKISIWLSISEIIACLYLEKSLTNSKIKLNAIELVLGKR